jgi:hypothetical protein
MLFLPLRELGAGKPKRQRNRGIHTGRSPFTVTRLPERVCGQ